MSTPAKCLPSATAVGATFDPALIELVGRQLLAEECKLKGASILLGPTCNTQRNPLGGRAFESFSEDPHLSGTIAAAYVKGVQAGGIGCAIKHFVANDKEKDRFAYDSILSDRALREIYLMPFMIAERDAKPWSFMTAYVCTFVSAYITLIKLVYLKLQPCEWDSRLGEPENYQRHTPN